MKMYARKNRCYVSVQGEGAKKFLQNLLSQDLNKLSPGHMLLSCVLNQKGGVEGFFWLHQSHAEGYVLDMLASMHDRVVQILKQYKLRAKVEIMKEASLTSYYAFEPLVEQGFEQHVFTFADGTVLYRRVQVNPKIKLNLAETEWINEETWEKFRIGKLWPRWEQDISAGTLALQSDFLREGIHFNKGCYLGQETIARLYARGSNVARKLVLLKAGLHDLHVGDSLMLNGEVKGEISSVLHDQHDKLDIALAMLHRSALEHAAELKTQNQHNVECVQ